jgi:hypothetical protein
MKFGVEHMQTTDSRHDSLQPSPFFCEERAREGRRRQRICQRQGSEAQRTQLREDGGERITWPKLLQGGRWTGVDVRFQQQQHV